METLYETRVFPRRYGHAAKSMRCANASVYAALRDLHIVVRKIFQPWPTRLALTQTSGLPVNTIRVIDTAGYDANLCITNEAALLRCLPLLTRILNSSPSSRWCRYIRDGFSKGRSIMFHVDHNPFKITHLAGIWLAPSRF
jgi:hypothetical protein